MDLFGLFFQDLLFVCERLPACVSLYHTCIWCLWRPAEGTVPRELELKVVTTSRPAVYVLGTKLNPYARARSALNHQAVSTAPRWSSSWPWCVALLSLALQHIPPACPTTPGYHFSPVLSLVLSGDLLRLWYGTVLHIHLETFSTITVLGRSSPLLPPLQLSHCSWEFTSKGFFFVLSSLALRRGCQAERVLSWIHLSTFLMSPPRAFFIFVSASVLLFWFLKKIPSVSVRSTGHFIFSCPFTSQRASPLTWSKIASRPSSTWTIGRFLMLKKRQNSSGTCEPVHICQSEPFSFTSDRGTHWHWHILVPTYQRPPWPPISPSPYLQVLDIHFKALTLTNILDFLT